MPQYARIAFFSRVCAVCALPEGVPALVRGDKCVVEMEYGMDVGTHMGVVDHDAPDEAEQGGRRGARILRKATEPDLARVAENMGLAAEALQRFVELNGEAGVFIKPLTAHYTLGRERLLIVFGAPDHVDCRRVVGKMQWDLKTRIEVRHVGVRDEAAVAGGIGPCGRPLCCATWLRNFRAVNVRMIRAQELSLNPTAINGCCGRLKCCLRYESTMSIWKRPRICPRTAPWCAGRKMKAWWWAATCCSGNSWCGRGTRDCGTWRQKT
jgi:cell fate regulator YaaT (PSP1 superfamily)